MAKLISAAGAKSAIHSKAEIALLDIREAGPFSMGHPLFAVPCPYSTLELHIGALVPQRDVPILLLDGGDGLGERAAARLDAMGYSDVAVVDGGARGWEAAGFTLYKGVNVPCKLLGELVGETTHGPKRIGPDELAQWKADGRSFDFFDCRPISEFEKMTVPGARCLPNGEVAHRLPAATEPDRPILLTCAGRTRGLIGAASLAAVAPEVNVYALENGTQGWFLSGRDLLRGNTAEDYPELDAEGRKETARRFDDFVAREGLEVIGARDVAGYLEDETRTTFLIDVRSKGEAEDDALAAFEHAPCVQLVQASDQWIGVRRARVVLADDIGLRAAIAAYWLRMLGFEPKILKIDDDVRKVARREVPLAPDWTSQPFVSVESALAHFRSGVAKAVDVRTSSAYRAGHLAGATWAIRPTIARSVTPGSKKVYLIGDGSGRAHLAVADLAGTAANVAVVRGGHAALAAAGAAIERSPIPREMDSPDITWFAHGRHDGDRDASRTYLNWETGLEHQLDADERAEYIFWRLQTVDNFKQPVSCVRAPSER